MDTVKHQIVEFLFRVQIEGPVEQSTGPRRNLGTARHESLDSFSGPVAGSNPVGSSAASSGGAERSGNAAVVSGGGASKRKGSRRRKRR